MPGGNPLAPNMFDRRASDTFNYFSRLNPERRSLVNALLTAMDEADEAGLEQLFGVKGSHLEEAVEANRAILESPRMAAMERYSPGVLYQAINFPDLPTGAQRRLLENGIIFSGLYGLLRPDDLVQNYRLKMDANLPGVGKVSQFWKPHISPLLNQTVEGRFVWNLLPGVHQDAWDDGRTYEAMVQVKFFKEEEGHRKPVTHAVKALRGELVRFIVQEAAESVEPLKEARLAGGYRLDEEASTLDDEARTGVLVMVKSDVDLFEEENAAEADAED